MADHPCIVIPGIKGTGLENIYELPPATTWSVADAGAIVPDFDSLALDANALVDETVTVFNRASQLLDVAYRSFAQALRGRGLPVYVFPYDWRYSNVRSANQLVHYVETLQQKNLKGVLPSTWDRAFDFACHSMGGVVFRLFLDSWRTLKPGVPLPVNRVVFIATPHLGSVDAVESMIRGETVLFGGQKELRKLSRTFPGVYELLPHGSLSNAVVDSAGAPLDVFDVNNWQESVTPDPNDPDDFDVEQAHLTSARNILNALPDVTRPEFGLAGRILVIYGNKPNSTIRIVTVLPNKLLADGTTVRNWYDFDDADKAENKSAGDEVVPLESAMLNGVPSVEIRSDDISFFNLKSHLLSLHALLPSLDEVSSVTSRFFSLTGPAGPGILPKGTDPSRFHPAG